MVALEEKPGDHQSHPETPLETSSGKHECLWKNSLQFNRNMNSTSLILSNFFLLLVAGESDLNLIKTAVAYYTDS